MREATKVMSHASCRDRYWHQSILSLGSGQEWERTYAIETVASANGSPTMCAIKFSVCATSFINVDAYQC
jgi:hypothetical protein